MTSWCGELLVLQPREQRRMVFSCVDRAGHDPAEGHRSGTDPMLRWRTSTQDPQALELWTEPWRDWAGRTVAERAEAGLPT